MEIGEQKDIAHKLWIRTVEYIGFRECVFGLSLTLAIFVEYSCTRCDAILWARDWIKEQL